MSLSRRFIGGNVGINTTSPTSTLDVSGTARITTSITSGAVYATNSTITNVVGTTISTGTILATTFTGGNMSLSGNLVIGGTLTTVNITTTNVVDTNITSSNINVTALATITNANITIGTVGTLINTNLVSSNTSSGTMNLSTGLTTATILATTSISSGAVNATNSTVTNVVSTNASSGTMNLSTGLTTATILATTSISSGAVNATNSTVTNSVVTSSTVTNMVATNVSSGTLNLNTGLTAGTILATTSISSGGVNATNSTVTNAVSTNASSGTLNLSTGLTAGTILATTSISSGAVNATNSTITNFVATSITAGRISASNNVNASQTIVVQNTNSGSSAYSGLTLQTDGVSNFNIFKNSTTRTDDGGVNVTTLRNDGGPLRLQSNTGMGIWVGSTGNVGINTTVPGSTLDIKGNSSWGLTRIAPNTSGGEAAIGFFALNDFTASGQATSGNWLLGTGINNSGVSTFSLFRNTTNILTVATNGNVGIGTTSPSAKLNVSGNAVIDSGATTNGNLALYNTIGGGVICLNDEHHSIWGRRGYNGSSDVLQLREYGQIEFWTGGLNANMSHRMTITSTGNVGINTTSPSERLTVNGSTDLFGTLRVGANSSSAGFLINLGTSGGGGNYRSAYLYGDGTSILFSNQQNGYINFGTNNIMNMLVIAPNGNVGVGTASPSTRLNVSGSTDIFGNLRVGGSSSSTAFNIDLGTSGVGGSRAGYLYGDGTTMYLTNQQNGGINFGTNNAWDKMVIDANGNVGVGTASPSYKLDVNGSFATNTMLIRSTSYSTTLGTQVYNANTWYVAIAPGILTSDATYIVSLTFISGATPWNIYTSFLNMIGITNDNQPLSTSGANVPTTIHANNSNGIDYQIKVRGSYAPNSSSGIQFSINGTTPSGYWTVKAYRII